MGGAFKSPSQRVATLRATLPPFNSLPPSRPGPGALRGQSLPTAAQVLHSSAGIITRARVRGKWVSVFFFVCTCPGQPAPAVRLSSRLRAAPDPPSRPPGLMTVARSRTSRGGDGPGGRRRGDARTPGSGWGRGGRGTRARHCDQLCPRLGHTGPTDFAQFDLSAQVVKKEVGAAHYCTTMAQRGIVTVLFSAPSPPTHFCYEPSASPGGEAADASPFLCSV